MPYEFAILRVLEGRRFEPRAERFPRGDRIQREARVGQCDRHDEACAQALPKTSGYDEPALVVKSVLDPTRKTRDVAIQVKISICPHRSPLHTTIARLTEPCNGSAQRCDGALRGTGGVAYPPKPSRDVRTIAALLLLGALFGCGGGGFVPGGPHAMDAATMRRIVATNARASGLPVRLVDAMIATESHGDPSAISRAGAQGLMQLMPETASAYRVADAFDPQQNVAGGCRYMHDLLARYHSDVSLALAAYNAGPGSVDAVHGIPKFPETRAYVARVTAALRTTN